MAAVFKLLDSFEGVLERPAISAQLEAKLVSLLQEFSLDLQEVRAYPWRCADVLLITSSFLEFHQMI